MTAPNQNKDTYTTSTGLVAATADWLDAHYLAFQSEYEVMLRWVGIQPNWHVLDAGCGSGSFLPLMTELVGAGGKVSAVDLTLENVQAVEARISQSQLPAPVEARVGNVLNLPYADQTFDAVWCANTVAYLNDEELRMALKEFRRVVRHGGLVAVKDFDGTAWQPQPCPPTLVLHLCEASQRRGNILASGWLRAIQMPTWLRGAGFTDIRQKPTLMERFLPLRPIERNFIGNVLKALSNMAQSLDLPSDELHIWEALADVDSSNHIFNHPDFYYRVIQTVVVGCVP